MFPGGGRKIGRTDHKARGRQLHDACTRTAGKWAQRHIKVPDGAQLEHQCLVAFGPAHRLGDFKLLLSRASMQRHGNRTRIRVIALADAWARRCFAVCFREQALVQPGVARMIEFLDRQARA